MVMINVLDFVQTLCWNIFDHVRIQKFAVGGVLLGSGDVGAKPQHSKILYFFGKNNLI